MPGPEEEEVARAAATYLAGELPVSRCHKPDADIVTPALRSQVAALGWFGLGVAENDGGVGLSEVDNIMLFREAGRYLAPITFLTTALGVRIAVSAGKSDLASSILSGEHHAALAVVESQSNEVFRVFDWNGASLAVEVGDTSATLYQLDAANVARIDCLDKTVSMGTVRKDSLRSLALSEGDVVVNVGTLNAAAMLIGMAEAELDMIVDYARIRETFGRPIGAYQAVRHPCADMAVRCEAARSQLYAAAVSLRDGRSDAASQIRAAKLLANVAAVRNADSNIQLHGGIAVTMEHDAHLYMKRANLLSRLFGAERVLLEQLLDTPMAA